MTWTTGTTGMTVGMWMGTKVGMGESPPPIAHRLRTQSRAAAHQGQGSGKVQGRGKVKGRGQGRGKGRGVGVASGRPMGTRVRKIFREQEAAHVTLLQ